MTEKTKVSKAGPAAADVKPEKHVKARREQRKRETDNVGKGLLAMGERMEKRADEAKKMVEESMLRVLDVDRQASMLFEGCMSRIAGAESDDDVDMELDTAEKALRCRHSLLPRGAMSR